MIQKIQFQLATSTNQPPKVGPSSEPTWPGMAIKLMARIKSPLGWVRSTAKRPTGSIMAPPTPCTTRAAIKKLSDGDSAHSTEPSTNTAIAQPNTRLVPKRSAIQPDAGISMAVVSEYATMTDCILSGLSPSDWAMAGKAVFRMVASSDCKKKAMATSHSKRSLCGASGVGLGVRAAAVVIGWAAGGQNKSR